MAVVVPTSGAGAYVNGTGNLTPVIPAGAQAGDLMLLFWAGKPYTLTPAVSGDWLSLGSATDGTTAAGADAGSMKVQVWARVHLGSETNPTITVTGANVSGAVIVAYRATASGAFELPVGAGGGDASAGTGFSVTAGGNLDGLRQGDMVVYAAALRSDSANPGAFTITASGATFGTATKTPTTDLSTTAGGDMDMSVGNRSVTAGSSTANPTLSATLAASHTGSAFLVRLREAPANHELGADGSADASGSALASIPVPVSASGSGNASSAASLSVGAPVNQVEVSWVEFEVSSAAPGVDLEASGVGFALGSAALAAQLSLGASAAAASASAASLAILKALGAAGSAQGAGLASLAQSTTLAGAGSATADATGDVSLAKPIAAAGDASADATGALDLGKPLSASGVALATGSGTVTCHSSWFSPAARLSSSV